MTSHRRMSRIAAVAGILFAWTGEAAAQSCAMCASSFGPNDPVTKAFNWSIIFLMAAPYTLFGAVAGYLFFTYRRDAARRRAAIVELPAARTREASMEGPEEVPT
jgi:hypothetical protein